MIEALSIYEYSQLFTIIAMLVFSFSLIIIGNNRTKHIAWLNLAKWLIVGNFAVIGFTTSIQYFFNLTEAHVDVAKVLSITTFYLSAVLLAVAFIPMVHNKRLRWHNLNITIVVFLICDAITWVSLACDRSLAMILVTASVTVYLIELVRITLFFVVDYRSQRQRWLQTGDSGLVHYPLLCQLLRCVILLIAFALLYVILVFMSENAKAIFNFAMLIVWGFLYAFTVNLIIDHNRPVEVEPQIRLSHNSEVKENDLLNVTSTPPYPDLGTKIDEWIASGGYCRQGLTMVQVAELFGTNRTYVSRFINGSYGCNFNTWLTRLRIEEAKRQMTASPELPIDTIALRVGFLTKSHFISSFKSIEGITPGMWRKTHK